MIAASAELAGILAATAVLMLTGALLPGYFRRRDLAARLSSAVAVGAIAPDLGGRHRVRGVSFRARRASANRLVAWLERRIERAGLEVSPGEVLLVMALVAALGALAGLLAGGPLAVAPAALTGGGLPLLWIRHTDVRRQKRFRAQLPDTVAMLAASVRAGHSLQQALERVAEDAPQPTSSALIQAVREIGLGAAQDEALARVAARFPSQELDLITAAMNVQAQVGGSLAKVLDEIVIMLRERVRIEGDIRALTAQQRYSAYVLALLPVAVAGALFVIGRDYVELLFEGALRFVALAAALMVLAGFLIMRRIATIDV